MRLFMIELFDNCGRLVIILEGYYRNRHEIEAVAERYIEKGHAASMGAPFEIENR